MKRVSTLVLSSLTAAFLVGCGGGSSTPATTASATDVTVERGAIWGATVIDSSTPAQTATQTSATSNVYTFASTPTYPIMATGGIIDLDGDATTTDDVYDFSGKTLTSYSEVITPITNYLGNPDDADYQTKLDKLKEITGATNDDLLNKVPSETSTDILVLTNTLYDILNDDDDSNDDFLTDYDNSAFKIKFDDSKSGIDDTLSLKEIAKLLEDQVLSTLGITKLTSDEVTSKISEIDDINKLSTGLEYEEWPIQGPTTYSAMKTAFLDATNPNYFGYNNTTYIFNSDNTICEKDSDGTDGVRADYSTCSSSIGTWTELNETMIATMSDGGKVFEKIINGNVWTAYSADTESDSSSSSTTSTTSENSDASKYLSASFSDPLGLAGKEITFSTTDHQNYYKFTFNNDGTLSGYINLDPECTGKYNNMYNDTMVGYVLTCGSYTSELALQSVTDSAYAELFTTFGDDSTMEELSIVEIVQ